MVETPLAAQAAGRLCHSPCGHQEGEKLPVRAVQIADVWEASQAQAGGKCAQRKQNGAQQRFLPQSEDGGTKAHNLSLYRDGVRGAICRIQAVEVAGRRGPRILSAAAEDPGSNRPKPADWIEQLWIE